jgi:hypothetical protein
MLAATDLLQPTGMFAASDNIWVALAMIIIGAISHWLQNRNKTEQEKQPWSVEDDAPPASYRQSAPPPVTPQARPLEQRERELESELRRLLGEEPPARTPPPLPPPLPPPVVRRAPLIRTVVIEDDEDTLAAGAAQMGQMRESARAHDRAAALQGAVEQRMKAVNVRTEKHVPEFGALHPSVAQPGQAMKPSPWRNRSAARQAMIASIIFGPPKGTEN